MTTRWILCLLALALLAPAARAAGPAPADDPGLASLFRERGLTGTLVLESLDGRTAWVHDPARAGERFLPASTFKIPNTLIALDEGAIRDEKEVIRWDGVDRGRAAWNRDQTLATAFPASCVWFYQALARRVGDAAYRRHLARLGYGNAATGPDVTTFWLDGDLRISAREQVAFHKRLYAGTLPYRAEHQALLREIMVVDRGPGYVLRAKTGWCVRVPAQLGWYVGWLELSPVGGRPPADVWFFALNLDITAPEQGRYREELARAALQRKGLLPPSRQEEP
jgi:beta-lactamase class D